MSFSNILRFFSNPSSMTALALASASMGFIYYFYSMASSSNSSAPEKEISSSNSSEPEIMLSSSDPSLITPGVSTSSSSIQKKSFKYDVFISFRGEDTRNNFVGHLNEALQRNCIETYKDDEKIDKGEKINDQLLKSIDDSRFYIIVFSKNYASSSWCLEELVKIMECQKMTEHMAFPVFYDVEPTQVRKQDGPVGGAFSKRANHEAAGKWRDAMKELADLAGWELKATANGDESKLIQMIVDAIFTKKNSTLSNDEEKLVGMETRISDVLSSLKIGTEDVRMIGIKGIGGGGKTTLARAVYDRLSNHFEGKSFVENVREVSKPTLSGLKKLQKRILKDVLNKQDIIFSSVQDGKIRLKATMSCRKTLVVLDDVDSIVQLEALVGQLNWFKAGSRIIITTRDEQVLRAHGVMFIHDVNLLSPEEAMCLFSMHALPLDLPIEGYKKLSEQVVRYASGLPLTIKVLSKFLRGQNEREWENAIQRLEKIPLKETRQILELSFDGLEWEYKEIFLDVACILKGWGKESAIRMLESRGFGAENGLRVLEQRSLLTYNEYEKLGMHDHLEEMGRDIVRRLYPNEPYKHSRLWINEEIEDILTNDQGTQATKCLYFQSPGFSAEIAMKGLAKMKDLRFLDIKTSYDSDDDGDECDDDSINWKFDKVSQYLPNSLQFVNWIGFPLSSLPNTFQGKHLVYLQLSFNKIVQLWEDGEEKVLNRLRFLTFESTKLQTFDLRVAPNLERLTIYTCYDFKELHMPDDHHPKLEYLIIYSSKLTSLHLGNTPNLETLELEGFHDLVELEMPAESLKLKSLYLSHSKLKTIHLRSTPNLEILILNCCQDLVELEMPSEFLKLKELNLSYSKLKTIHLKSTPNLVKLILNGCNDLVELEMPAESLKLALLDLSHSKLKTIHLDSFPNLEKLILKGCNDLVELKLPSSLKLKELNVSDSKLTHIHLGNTLYLETLNLRHSKLTNLHLLNTPNLKALLLDGSNDLVELQMPSECLKLEELSLGQLKLRNLDLGLTPILRTLNLKDCYDLVEINTPIGCLKKLSFLDLSGCGRFNFFWFSKWSLLSQPAEAGSFSELHLIAEPTDICLLHPDNTFPKFLVTCHYKEDRKSSFENLERLILMGLCACTNLENFSRSICSLRGLRKLTLEGSIPEVPRDLDQLECLEELIFSSTEIRNLPGSVCKLKHLKSLKLKSCLLLEKLPDDLGRIESLETLIITDCNRLRDIPKNMGKIKCVISPRVYKRYARGKYKQRPITDAFDRPTGANTSTKRKHSSQ